jgi:hypothetical protein
MSARDFHQRVLNRFDALDCRGAVRINSHTDVIFVDHRIKFRPTASDGDADLCTARAARDSRG